MQPLHDAPALGHRATRDGLPSPQRAPPPEPILLGLHWIARATGCDPARLADVGVLADTLRALPAELGLTRIGEPVVSSQDGGGVAGVVLLAESHASLHAVPHAGTLFADVFSCAPFSADVALAVLTRAYAPAEVEARLVERGPAFPPREGA